MLARDRQKPLLPLEIADNGQPLERINDKFDRFELSGVLIGNQHVGYTRSKRLLHLAGEDWTPEE